MTTKTETAFLAVNGVDLEVRYVFYPGLDEHIKLNHVDIYGVFVKGVDIYDIISRSTEIEIIEQIRDMERETKENRGELV